MGECVSWSSCQFVRGLHDFRRWIFFQSLSSFPFSLPSVLGTQISPLPHPRERSRYLAPNRPIFLSPSFPQIHLHLKIQFLILKV